MKRFFSFHPLARASWPALAALLVGGGAGATSLPPPPTQLIALAPLAYRELLAGDEKPRPTPRLPANFPTFLAWEGDVPLPEMRLFDVTDATPVEVPLRIEPRPVASEYDPELYDLRALASVSSGGNDDERSLLTPGHAYEFRFDIEFGYIFSLGPQRVPFEVTAAAPLPTAAGSLELVETTLKREVNADGQLPRLYNVVVKYTPSEELRPWFDAYTADFSLDAKDDTFEPHPQATVMGHDISGLLNFDRRREEGPVYFFEQLVSCGEATDPIGHHTFALAAGPITFPGPVVRTALDVDLDCTRPFVEPPAPPVTPRADSPAEDDGCTVASPGRGARGLLALGLVASSLFVRSRRRGRLADDRR
jgi:hypothetical protein